MDTMFKWFIGFIIGLMCGYAWAYHHYVTLTQGGV